jgi:hypothetical protein
MNELYVKCNCDHPNHSVVFREESAFGRAELWIFTQLSPYLPRHRRFWNGLKYAFGVDVVDPCWADTNIDYDQLVKLSEFLSGVVARNRHAEEKAAREAMALIAEQSKKLKSWDLLHRALESIAEIVAQPGCQEFAWARVIERVAQEALDG